MDNYSDYLSIKPEENATPFRVSILRGYTVEPLVPVLSGEIIRAGFKPVIDVGMYSSALYDAGKMKDEFDCVILTQWLNELSPLLSDRFISLSSEHIDFEIARVVSYTESIIHFLREKTSAVVLINNFPIQKKPTLGIIGHDEIAAMMRLNAQMLEMSRRYRSVYIVDYFRVLAETGFGGLDSNRWITSKSPLSASGLVAIGKEYGTFFRAMKGLSKKCLVMDCDNTLWNGILGEEGAFVREEDRDFQKYVLNLHDRGIILALCSKNNEKDVLEFIKNSPDMILKESHLSTWQINWEDKASNLKRIAADLNIGLDSMVFVDDSLFERDFISQSIPEVTVVPDHSTHHLDGLFDSLTFSEEDKNKTEMYRADKERKEMAKSFPSVQDYLKSLDMVATIETATQSEVSRISQLTQKTNQFNLTVRRYTEEQIVSFIEWDNSDVIYLRLKDKFSDLGLVGVAIVLYYDNEAVIDTLLLSCRAFGRNAEDVLLTEVINRAVSRGIRTIIGNYSPTAKNKIAGDFIEAHGFIRGKLIVDSQMPFPEWIRVE